MDSTLNRFCSFFHVPDVKTLVELRFKSNFLSDETIDLTTFKGRLNTFTSRSRQRVKKDFPISTQNGKHLIFIYAPLLGEFIPTIPGKNASPVFWKERKRH